MYRTLEDWDTLRVFLEVSRVRGLRRAAKSLGVSHATLRRRLASLEAELGLHLFDRRPDGLHPTAAARELLPMAEQLEATTVALARKASGLSPSLEGWIHISAPDMLMSELLAPTVADFARKHPKIKVRIDTSYAIADLGGREADLALRLLSVGEQPDGALVGSPTPLYAAVYGTGDQWIGWDGNDGLVAETEFADRPATGAFNNVYLQRALCIEGLGITLLPCFMAPKALLQRTEPIHAANLWVLLHPDQRRNPRLRLFREAMAEALR